MALRCDFSRKTRRMPLGWRDWLGGWEVGRLGGVTCIPSHLIESFGDNASHAKVCDFDDVLLVQQHVFGLHIPDNRDGGGEPITELVGSRSRG